MEGEGTEVTREASVEVEAEVEAAVMEPEEEPEQTETAASLFPLSGSSLAATATQGANQWLSNSSFTVDLSAINAAVASLHSQQTTAEAESEPESEEDRVPELKGNVTSGTSYELLESSESDRDSERDRKKKKKKRKRKRSRDRGDAVTDFGARKSDVRAWAGSDNKPTKEYYFDSRGDRDNLAFGSLYRMDVARYKPFNPEGNFGIEFGGMRKGKGSLFERDGDIDALDNKLKSAGRYWSPKYSALERHKSYKRIRIHVLAPQKLSATVPGEFIALSELEISHEQSDGNSSAARTLVEESWEDEVLRKTREFNKMTRECPHDEKVWFEFAEFQDKVSSMQPQKGARLQTLEKKISILEKATELNPDNEELLLSLLKAYQSRDSSDVLIERWERVLILQSGSCKLWREFIRVVQGEFSRFKVTDLRKIYAHAIQALSSALSKQSRQHHQNGRSPDSAITELELGLVDIFLSLCRFEWQAGYKELATALFQAEIEFSLFCPSLLLTENSKQRLFEHFWSSDAARVGEDRALGWSVWLEKEEEERLRAVNEEISSEDDKGGWTGWSEPISKSAKVSKDDEEIPSVAVEGLEKEIEPEPEAESEDVNQQDDTEALLKMLGIDVDAGANAEVKDTSTWVRWSEEESSRDNSQWMPVHAKSAEISQSDGKPGEEDDEQFLRVILYEDVSEYLFSLRSEEARLSLVTQFVDFFGGKICQRVSTNSSSWIEKLLSLEAFPDSLSQYLRSVHILIDKQQITGCNIEALLSSKSETPGTSNMMTFIRNVTLLCLNAFPRNHILQEAALVAEEQRVTKINSSSDSPTPCRALAKSLLKNDRKDVLLCGVYAQREAFFGNMDHARRVFDMALSSVQGLPEDQRSNVPLLYFWYAEMELASSLTNDQQSASRALHILSCLGSGVAYTVFKCQLSNLQLLRARQGFKERLKEVRAAWMRGAVDDQSVAIVCSAAIFEEMTTGWSEGIEILNQTFMVVLPERRSKSYHLEMLLNFYLKMLQRHHKQLNLPKIWDSVLEGLQIYPFNPEVFNILIDIGHLYAAPNKLRWIFDEHCNRRPSVIAWLFALAFDVSRENSQHRIRGLFERALANDRLRTSVVLWRCYIAYEIDIAQNPSAARRIFFRAIHACPWSKKLWLDGFLKLNSILTAKELSDLQEVMRDKELNLRTDIYEILLQDEVIS